MNEPANRERQSHSRSKTPIWSFSLRELLMLMAIVALAMIYFVRPNPSSRSFSTSSKALYVVDAPIEYRYWHQRGNKGDGTGFIGTGNEWKPALGVEVFDTFAILHLDNGMDRMIEREGLRWFDWRRVEKSSKGSAKASNANSGH